MSLSTPSRFALLSAVLLASACSRNSEPSAASPAKAPAAAPATPAPAVAAEPASDDGIFKYTITTEADKFRIVTGIDPKSDQIEILVAINSVEGQYPVKYDLDCEGDGEFEYKGLTKNQKCVYKKNSGRHQIFVRGEIPAMFLCTRKGACSDDCKNARCEACIVLGAPDEFDDSRNAVISIDSWGNIPWKSMNLFASRCYALEKLPDDSPDLSQVKDMSEMFSNASSFNQPLDAWDVSSVTDMSAMFAGAQSFNQPLEKWNTANVTNMSGMFAESAFNQPLEAWDMSKVKHMGMMFRDATSFNQPLENWNVSSAISMEWMFSGAKAFNQPLGKWDVSKVFTMEKMFADAESFDQPLDQWNIANVDDMRAMFKGAKAFAHYPKGWVVPADASMDMFKGTKVEAEAEKSPLKTR